MIINLEYHEKVYDRIHEFLLMNVLQYTIDHMLATRLLWKAHLPIGFSPYKYVKNKWIQIKLLYEMHPLTSETIKKHGNRGHHFPN
jgi:hypothetical protein